MEDSLFDGLDEATRKEIEELMKVTREKDGNSNYARAQFIISTHRLYNKEYDLSLEYLKKIKKSDNKELYELAEMNKAVMQYYHKDDLDKASEALTKLLAQDTWVILDASKYAFYFAQEYISRVEYEKAIKLLEEVSNVYPYETYCYIKICKLLTAKKDKTIGELLLSFLEKSLTIMNVLTLDFDGLSIEGKLPERKLAHYTSPEVADILLNIKENAPHAFRSNTINNVNDPSEGQLLERYLDFSENDFSYNMKPDDKLHAFISCFTFNHDSLNQFRLYGKQDNKEASGISFVFNEGFFKSKHQLNGLTFIPFQSHIQIIPKKERISEKNKADSIEINKKIGKQSVMRCIYLDPDSRYIQLAQRNRLTFYREFEPYENAEEKWQEYNEEISKKTVEVERALQILVNIYQEIRYEYSQDFKMYSDFIDEILLPLKYLVKHSAFQEEQECRMVYITSLDDPRVQMDFGKFLYVEYEPEVKANLDKIYIAPAATQYQPYLAKLLCGTNSLGKKIKIDLSNNPFRLPTSH